MPLKTNYSLLGLTGFLGASVEIAAINAASCGTLDDALRACENATFPFANLRCGRGGHHVWVSYRKPDGEWKRVVLVEER